MLNEDKSIFLSVILLVIATWSAFAFYWTGFANGKQVYQNKITTQQVEIAKLQKKIDVLEKSSSGEYPIGLTVSKVHF